MSLVLIAGDRDLTTLQKGLCDVMPDVNVQCWPRIENPESVQMAVLWKQPKDCLKPFTNIRALASLGAGVDGIVSDDSINNNLPVTRIVDQALTGQMAEYVLATVLSIKCQLGMYFKQQQQSQWIEHRRLTANNVVILGVGELGQEVGNRLVNNGFNVAGWSRTKKTNQNFACYAGDIELKQLLSSADFVVCLMPSTEQTKEFCDRQFFNQMQSSAYFINVSRGELVNEQDLVNALEEKLIAGAFVDVYHKEPLPTDSPLWHTKNLFMTPHIAAITDQKTIIKQIAENYQRLIKGEALKNTIDLSLGY